MLLFGITNYGWYVMIGIFKLPRRRGLVQHVFVPQSQEKIVFLYEKVFSFLVR